MKGNDWDWSNDWWAKAFNQQAGTLQEIRAQASDDSAASARTLQADPHEAEAPQPGQSSRPSASTAGRDRWTGFRSRAGAFLLLCDALHA